MFSLDNIDRIKQGLPKTYDSGMYIPMSFILDALKKQVSC